MKKIDIKAFGEGQQIWFNIRFGSTSAVCAA